MIDKLFLILICGLPFGHFLFKKADLWHGQGHFFQAGLLIIFCWSFFEKRKQIKIINKPLGIFTLWTGLITSYLWITTLVATQNYPVKIFMPFFNWLCFILFYKLSLEYLDEEKIEKILKWFKYSVIILLFYCVLQYLRLDEFLKGLSLHDELVGTIGNSGHLAGYLAIVQPLFFDKRDILPLILLWSIILLTGSASGIFVGLAVILFWLFIKEKSRWFWSGLALSILGLGIVIVRFSNFLTFSGRLEIWKLTFETFKDKAITGFGLGSFPLLKLQNLPDISIWRHLHNEYYQVAFEAGFIGLGLILWCIWDYFNLFRTFKTNLTIRLATIFFGFCLLALFTFPVHLWQVAIIGMIGYSFIYVIKNNSGIQALGV